MFAHHPRQKDTTNEVKMTQPKTPISAGTRKGHLRHVGAISFVISILAVVAVIMILFGARFGLWEPIDGFVLYRTYFNLIAYIAAGTALAALLFHVFRKDRRGIALSGVATLIGAVLLTPLALATLDPPVRAPPIHDISTDTQTPPAFLVLDDTRPGAQNSLQYAGQEIAIVQAEAYPDVAPILTEMSGPDAFDRAVNIANDMGWIFVAQQDEDLRFEATAHTPIFHFADDVVVVVTPQQDGSRVDIRSVSRVGRSDQGVNAKRIMAFIAAFD
jgi:uncharacterized protein (DUF1499 family)